MNINIEKYRSLTFITWMQMIGCVLVILGHSYPFVTAIPNWAFEFRNFLYDFHMPLFVWCSGYLMVATGTAERYTFQEYCKRRFVRILLPYLMFSVIGFVPKVLLAGVLNDKLNMNLLEIIRVFLVPRESIWGHFWFLPMIFFLGIIGYFILRLKVSGGVLLSVSLMIGTAVFFAPVLSGWFSLNDIVHFFVYFVLGMICGKIEYTPKQSSALVCACVISVIAGVMLFLLTLNGRMIQFIISILMLNAVWMLSLLLEKIYSPERTAVYSQTYSIFILSWPCQLVVEIILERVLGLSFYVIFPAMCLSGLAVPLLLIGFVDWIEKKTHTKILSLTIGK